MKPAVKRAILVLSILMLVALGTLAAIRIYRFFAFTDGDYTFVVLQDGTAEIRNYRGSAKALVIPSTLKKRPVTRIGAKAFNWRFFLTDVAIPEGVVAIDEGAFAGCYGLKNVSLPESLEEIGRRAFADCRGLKQLTLPEKVTAIGSGAFDRCLGLTTINLPDSVISIPANPFTGCKALEEIAVSPSHPELYMADGALYDRAAARLICCPYLRAEGRFAMPEGTVIVGVGAFQDCDRLTGVDLPESLETISDHAFDGCTHLETVRIPEGVTAIGNAAFSDCSGMTGIVVSNGVKEIGYLAFYNCASLKDITLPAGIADIGGGAFIGCRDLVVTLTEGTYAETYCRNNNLLYSTETKKLNIQPLLETGI